jgi:UrcA family protein
MNMNRKIAVSAAIRAAVAAAAVLMVGATALAQETEGVTVEAVRQSKIVGHTSSGIPIEEFTLRRKVSYADLDLKQQAGAAELEKRVKETAKSACDELDTLYPLTKSATEGAACVKKSTDDAMVLVHRAIAVAAVAAKK